MVDGLLSSDSCLITPKIFISAANGEKQMVMANSSGVFAGAKKHLLILLIPIGLGLLAITAQVAFADTTTQSAMSHAAWFKNVSITYSGTDMTIVSDGLPSWKAEKYAKPNAGVVVPLSPSDVTLDFSSNLVSAQKISYAITLNPVKAAAPTSTSLGVIGILVNGAVLYNPYEGDGKSVAVANNVFLTDSNGVQWGFLDVCNGHPGMGGMYHYHGMPPCVTSVIDTVGGPSHILGVAFDGFPIYGNKDINGKVISSTQLDDCNGITSPTPEFPAGLYHYVLTEEKSSRSTINCYSGTPNAALITKAPGAPANGGMPGGPGGAPGSMPGMGPPPGGTGMTQPGLPTVDPLVVAAAKAAAEKAAADAKAAADKAAAELKALQEAEAKAAAELKAKQEAETKAAAEKLIADAKVAAEKIIADAQAAMELKAKQEAEAKAAAELKAKQDAEAKAAVELKAKQEAEAKAAAELKAKQEAEAKAAADKAAAAKAAAAKKMITISCIKGKTVKKVTALKPVCPKGYTKK